MALCRKIVGPGISLCYSIKANPFLVSAMAQASDALEVCSPGELEICAAAGLSPDLVLYSGVTKTAADIERALSLGVSRFTCESRQHARLLNEAAEKRGLRLPVLLRLSAGSQFGMDEADLCEIVENRDAYPGLSVQGIHYFAGTQQKRLSGQKKQLEKLSQLMEKLRLAYGFSTEQVEYGPGLFFPYFEGEDSGDTLAPLRQLAPDLQAFAASCQLTIEMGRFFASPCGAYLTQVVDTKVTGGSRIAILDGGIHQVNYYGSGMGMRLPLFCNLSRPRKDPGAESPAHRAQDEEAEWMLCGSLCTTADVLVRAARIPEPAPGDVFVFRNAGAYSVTEAPALFLSRQMPGILLSDGGKILVLREPMPSWRFNSAAQSPRLLTTT